MDTFHTVLVYAGYVAASGALVFCVVSLVIKSEDATGAAGTGMKAVGWALLLALASSILDRLIG